MLPFMHTLFERRSNGQVIVISLILLLFGLNSGAKTQTLNTLPAAERVESIAAATVIVALPTVNKLAPSTFVSPVTVDNVTGLNISAYQFNILYDPSVIAPSGPNFGCSTTGTLSAAAGLGATCNNQVIDATHAKVLIAAFGSASLTGSGTILNVQFTTTGTASNISPLQFQELYLFNNVGFVANAPVDGQVTLLMGPTAATASLSGRAIASDGRPAMNAQIILSNNLGLTLRAISNPFGYYRFENVPTGSNYVLSASSKRFVFQTRMVSIADDIAAFDLVANP